ncbi:MAG: metallophosphatase, partial [Eubacteriales bacterium]|nr:metallophosphatase [Eubacteriales bacterium]
WKGGKVQSIRKNILHLMRGRIFTIEEKTFFTMGGAACHDIQNGVLDPTEPDFLEKYNALQFQRKFVRIKHMSWWEHELPSEEEMDRGRINLCLHDKKVDYVITHCAPSKIQQFIMMRTKDHTYPANALTDFLQEVYDECSFSHWFCGHYHSPMNILKKFHLLYEAMIPLP